MGVFSPKMITVKKLFVRDETEVSVELEAANSLNPL